MHPHDFTRICRSSMNSMTYKIIESDQESEITLLKMQKNSDFTDQRVSKTRRYTEQTFTNLHRPSTHARNKDPTVLKVE